MKTFYRIFYKSDLHGLIKSPNFYDLETAQRVADSLNRELQPSGEYLIESTDISELDPDQLVRLYRLKLITDKELFTYAGFYIAEQELKRRENNQNNQHFA